MVVGSCGFLFWNEDLSLCIYSIEVVWCQRLGKIAEFLGTGVGKMVMAVVEMKIEEKFSNLVVGRRKR